MIRKDRSTLWDGAWGDVRYAVRSLRNAPAFTTIALLCLAIGIGANTIMFGVAEHLFLKPPAGVQDPGRVVRLYLERRMGGAPFPDRAVSGSRAGIIPRLHGHPRCYPAHCQGRRSVDVQGVQCWCPGPRRTSGTANTSRRATSAFSGLARSSVVFFLADEDSAPPAHTRSPSSATGAGSAILVATRGLSAESSSSMRVRTPSSA